MKISATCTKCGHRHDVEVYGSINVGKYPELREKVRNGSLFVWECPDCGQPNLVRSETIYHDPEGKLMVWLLPEGSVPQEQFEEMEKHLDSITKDLEGYTLRRVSDVGSLIEKVSIHDAGLDDIVIEMTKYVTRMELAGKAGDKAQAIMDAPFKFYRIEGADNAIVLSFPLDGAMQGVHIGFNVYEDCSGILRRNPSISAGPGFAKIDAEWLARFFK